MILVLFSLLNIPAHADPALQADMACDAAFIEFTSPFNGQDAVPLDIAPAVGLRGLCSIAPEYTLTLSVSDALIETITFESRQSEQQLFEMRPSTPLEPNTEYTLETTPQDGWGEATVIQFMTGDRQVAGLEGTPRGEVIQAEVDLVQSMTYAELTLTPAIDNDSLSIVRITSQANGDAILEDYRVLEDTRSFDTSFMEWHESQVPEEVCFNIQQRNGRGEWIAGTAPFCAVPTVNHSLGRCASIPLSGLSWFLPLVTLVTVTRRKTSA